MHTLEVQGLATAAAKLAQAEAAVFANADSFANRFCTGDVMDITGVWFSSRQVKFAYVLDCGQHISDEIPLDEFCAWFQSIVAA